MDKNSLCATCLNNENCMFMRDQKIIYCEEFLTKKGSIRAEKIRKTNFNG